MYMQRSRRFYIDHQESRRSVVYGDTFWGGTFHSIMELSRKMEDDEGRIVLLLPWLVPRARPLEEELCSTGAAVLYLQHFYIVKFGRRIVKKIRSLFKGPVSKSPV